MSDSLQDSAPRIISTPTPSMPRIQQFATHSPYPRSSIDSILPMSPNPHMFHLFARAGTSMAHQRQTPTQLSQSPRLSMLFDPTTRNAGPQQQQVGSLSSVAEDAPVTQSQGCTFTFPDPSTSSVLSSSTLLTAASLGRQPSMESALLSPSPHTALTAMQLNRNLRAIGEPSTPSSTAFQQLSGNNSASGQMKKLNGPPTTVTVGLPATSSGGSTMNTGENTTLTTPFSPRQRTPSHHTMNHGYFLMAMSPRGSMIEQPHLLTSPSGLLGQHQHSQTRGNAHTIVNGAGTPFLVQQSNNMLQTGGVVYPPTPTGSYRTPTQQGTARSKFSFPNVASSTNNSGNNYHHTTTMKSTSGGMVTTLAAAESNHSIPNGQMTPTAASLLGLPYHHVAGSAQGHLGSAQSIYVDPKNQTYYTAQSLGTGRGYILQELTNQNSQIEPGKQVQYPYRALDATKPYRQTYSTHDEHQNDMTSDSDYMGAADSPPRKRQRAANNVLYIPTPMPGMLTTQSSGGTSRDRLPHLHIPHPDTNDRGAIYPTEYGHTAHTTTPDPLHNHSQALSQHQRPQIQQQQQQQHPHHHLGYSQPNNFMMASNTPSAQSYRPVQNTAQRVSTAGPNGPGAASHRRRRRRQLPNQLPNRNKFCAACKTKSSVYFREIRVMPGHKIVFCNGCCLRYKKVNLACIKCLYVPYKSDEGLGDQCRLCGGKLVCLEGQEFQQRLSDDPIHAAEIGLVAQPSQTSEDASEPPQRASRFLRPSQQQIQQQQRVRGPADELIPPHDTHLPTLNQGGAQGAPQEYPHPQNAAPHLEQPSTNSNITPLDQDMIQHTNINAMDELSPSLRPQTPQMYPRQGQGNQSLFSFPITLRTTDEMDDGQDGVSLEEDSNEAIIMPSGDSEMDAIEPSSGGGALSPVPPSQGQVGIQDGSTSLPPRKFTEHIDKDDAKVDQEE